MKVDLSPAQLERRVMAGLVDGVILVALCAAYFLLPALLLGIVLPMWGVLAAVIGYSVVPLAVFKQTLGMRLHGIELVGKEGHAVALGDVLFRELLGRGWFPAAFLFNLFFSWVASVMGYARFAMPAGLQATFFIASVLAVFVAVLGHLLVLGMKDRRSIADLMARSWVVPQQARPLPEDADELAEAKAARSRSIRNVVIAEVVIVCVGLAAPWLLTRKTESTEQRAARLLKQKLEKQFEQNPGSDSAARELAAAHEATGAYGEAEQVRAKHGRALDEGKKNRLALMLKELDARPGDEQQFIDVLRVLEEEKRFDEAKARYAKFLAEHEGPEYRAGYAEWLSQLGFLDEGIAEFRTVIAEHPDFEGAHKYLARALVMAERLPEAQEEYQRELVLRPTDLDAKGAMEELDAELGPLPKEKLAAMRKELAPVLKK